MIIDFILQNRNIKNQNDLNNNNFVNIPNPSLKSKKISENNYNIISQNNFINNNIPDN